MVPFTDFILCLQLSSGVKLGV
uniref:Uncharacterized protein n=1 Tax=Rhizophora mucronata TaxID=61149 RepID=A0A2P2NQI5_RHIMU